LACAIKLFSALQRLVFLILHFYFISLKMQKFPIISQIEFYNEHVLTVHFLFKHEMRIDAELLNSVLKRSQSVQIISLPCSVIIQL
jgi:hypothetical protein